MLVEVYTQSEDVTIADADEATALAEELGLQGQQEVLHPSGERMPFAEMSLEEKAVYSTFFSKHVKVEEYDRCAIPVRVMECLRDHKKHFEEVEVWFPPSTRDEDPLLVGINTPDPERTWTKSYHLMARWGTALVDFEELAEKAARIWAEKYKLRAEQAYLEAKKAWESAKATTPESMRALMQERSDVPSPSFYGGSF